MGNNINDGLQELFKKGVNLDVELKATFSTPQIDRDVEIDSLDVIGDYINAIGDNMTLIIDMPMGVLMYDFVPYRDDLNVTFTLTTNGIEKKIITLAILDQLPGQLEDPNYKKLPKSELDKAMVKVQLHILDFPLLALKSTPINGVYLNTTLEQVIINIFKKDAIDVSSLAEYKPIDLKFAKVTNTRVYDHINIGYEKKVIGVPKYLQEEYGLYNEGVNVYKPTFENLLIDKHTFHIYPPFKRPSIVKMIIHIYDDFTFSAVDNTFFTKDNIMHVGATMSTPLDMDNSKQYTKGVNRTHVSPEQFSYRKTLITKENHNLDFTYETTIRKNKHNTPIQDLLIPFEPMVKTDNPYQLVSTTISELYTIVQVIWNNSLLTVYEPCMACIIVLREQQIEAHLVHTHVVYTKYGTKTVMTLAIKKKMAVGGGSDGTSSVKVL